MDNSSFDCIWEEIHSEKQWGQYPSEDVIRFVARNYYSFSKEERRRIKILDFGCGAGANTWYLAREGFDVYAFDGSKTAVEKTRMKLIKDGLNVSSLEVKDSLDLNYEQDFFDCIIDAGVIVNNLVSNIKKNYINVYRMLKTSGKFFSTVNFTVNMSGYETGKKLENNTFRDIKKGKLTGLGIIHLFSKDEIIDLATEAGFKDIKCDEVRYTERGGDLTTEYYMIECTK